MEKEPKGLLANIHFPSDLRQLPISELPTVCEELRQTIIQELADNPGHFASSLGVVELTVALHYVFNTPYDRIVWDVGHQAAGHKILTGRKDLFNTYRKLHGLRPFPSPQESEYDTFSCGHASNSISAALGMAVAAQEKGETDRQVVAVIGDGSMSGGLAYEGLNNVSSTINNLLIILNDNNMSIDHSVGGMKHYLHQLHTSKLYNYLRFRTSQHLFKWGILNESRRQKIIRFNNSLKSLLGTYDVSSYGGAPMLGLRGLVVKTHGNAEAIEIQNALGQCITFTEQKLTEQFQTGVDLRTRRTAAGSEETRTE